MVALFAVVSLISLADRTLVLINGDSAASVAIGAEYGKRRGVSTRLVVHCQDSAQSAKDETMPYSDFRARIEAPLRSFLSKHPQIDFVVLTKGVPIRIEGAPGLGVGGVRPSLDSYIAALGYETIKGANKVTLTDTGFSGNAWTNRFWNSGERFSHAKFGGYLVTRLDGYTADEARALILRSLAAEREKPTGPILLDACASFGFADPKSRRSRSWAVSR